MPKSMNIEIEGNQVRLQREQWSGNVAYISNYPGLLEEVKKYTWTYTSSGHPYLNCSKLNISLHKFVLQFLYGEEKLNEMLGKENIMRSLEKYNTIMNLQHHVSKTRPQMPMSDRAAQFAPFAALTGYDSAIKETGRLTAERIELDEEALTALDMKYQLLMDAFDDAPEVTITYFQPDERKAGGKYLTATGAVKKVDDFERRITTQDGTKIPMDDVLSIDGELFSSLE